MTRSVLVGAVPAVAVVAVVGVVAAVGGASPAASRAGRPDHAIACVASSSYAGEVSATGSSSAVASTRAKTPSSGASAPPRSSSAGATDSASTSTAAPAYGGWSTRETRARPPSIRSAEDGVGVPGARVVAGGHLHDHPGHAAQRALHPGGGVGALEVDARRRRR